MSKNQFNMRLSCSYEGENAVKELDVELLEAGEWKRLDLNAGSPGFVIFVYAIFTCQHMFMRVNAMERGVVLDSSQGVIEVITSESWEMEKLDVRFEAKMVSGDPSQDDVDYVIERMQQCPVSKNLLEPPEIIAIVEFSR